MAFTRQVLTLWSDQGIPDATGYTCPEQDIGDNAVAQQITLFFKIPSWLSGPASEKRIDFFIHPRHTTGGDDFDDSPLEYRVRTDANQAYYFKVRIESLPRFFRVRASNRTGAYADHTAAWIEFTKLT